MKLKVLNIVDLFLAEVDKGEKTNWNSGESLVVMKFRQVSSYALRDSGKK